MELEIRSGDVRLPGELRVPRGAAGLVIFAEGSGSSRNSPRNRELARVLYEARLACLVFDLLTLEEERAERLSAHLRFDVELLARRLADTTAALLERRGMRHLPVGYLACETGCAAALMVAAEWPDRVTAVVSRSGRPDLAGAALASVQAPTLFIVGERDRAILTVNRQALAEIQARTELRTISGASHRFDEPGAFDRVAHLARDWFETHLPSAAHAGR